MGRLRVALALAKTLADFGSGHFGKHEIQQEQIRTTLVDRINDLIALADGLDFKSFLAKIVTNEFLNVPVVFGYENVTFAMAASNREPPILSNVNDTVLTKP